MSDIREKAEADLRKYIERNPEAWKFDQSDLNRSVDWTLAWDIRSAVRTVHLGRYTGATATEARVRNAVRDARLALRELTDALHEDRRRRRQEWKDKHDVR